MIFVANYPVPVTTGRMNDSDSISLSLKDDKSEKKSLDTSGTSIVDGSVVDGGGGVSIVSESLASTAERAIQYDEYNNNDNNDDDDATVDEQEDDNDDGHDVDEDEIELTSDEDDEEENKKIIKNKKNWSKFISKMYPSKYASKAKSFFPNTAYPKPKLFSKLVFK